LIVRIISETRFHLHKVKLSQMDYNKLNNRYAKKHSDFVLRSFILDTFMPCFRFSRSTFNQSACRKWPCSLSGCR